jgi:hypothetical protein
MKVAGVLGVAAVLGLAAGLGLWLWAEEPTGAPAPSPPPRRELAPEEFRQWLKQLTPVQKAGLLRIVVGSLREDVLAEQRRAAEQRFRTADTDGNGQLSFEEAWQAGLFRPPAGRREARPAPGPASGPPAPEGHERGRTERQPGPELNVEAGEQPPFPVSELEQELLESWELLQELNVIGRESGER